MNILRTTLAAALSLAAAQSAFAAGAEPDQTALSGIAVRAGATIVVDCRYEKLPARSAVGAVLDTNNASAIERGREVVEHYAHRECMRGAGYVVFVRDGSTAPASLALAGTRP
ncbi:MAG: hypothetical protein JSS42_08715 [Proteobacteria bacterium]|uniref:hypothetical protein n=1 Tax=Rudaea sp. TaxID=2136325 RepID=UPI00321F6EAE|nr:hypothetical protein [Pseudomonadota bacterium]